jgi:hypothetical protein
MHDHDSSRRDFLQRSAVVAGTSWARLSLPALATIAQASCTARDGQAAFTTLSIDEALEFEAIAARILPATATPGAREAGVIYFLDQTAAADAGSLGFMRAGLAEFQAAVSSGVLFSDLNESEQDAHLETQQETPFFGFMRVQTLFGFFGMSKYGGNKNDIGWKLVGMDPHVHTYEAPFGYYDAEYMKAKPGD